MLLKIPEVLSPAQLEQVRGLLRDARFVDGRLSAGREAGRVKRNEELSADDQQRIRRLNEIVMNALVQHPHYQLAALPLRVASPFYARYTPGMGYGFHVDDPVMGPGGQRYRSDVSLTVFLNDMEDYDGGELEIRTAFGIQQVKLPAGHVVLYPSSSLHRVAEVTRGERLVAVTWVQSMVRDPARRELLYELGLAREGLLTREPDTEETARVSNTYVNLVRMWAEL